MVDVRPHLCRCHSCSCTARCLFYLFGVYGAGPAAGLDHQWPVLVVVPFLVLCVTTPVACAAAAGPPWWPSPSVSSVDTRRSDAQGVHSAGIWSVPCS